jgi:hypothetical protein
MWGKESLRGEKSLCHEKESLFREKSLRSNKESLLYKVTDEKGISTFFDLARITFIRVKWEEALRRWQKLR